MKKIIFILIGLLAFVGCDYDGIPKEGEDSSHTYNVRYEVTGDVLVDIDYQNETGGETELENVVLPFTISFTATLEKYEIFYVKVAATINNIAGSVQSSIYVNDELFQYSHAEGDYVIAWASGWLRYDD